MKKVSMYPQALSVRETIDGISTKFPFALEIVFSNGKIVKERYISRDALDERLNTLRKII
jgi:hypothetical protein